MLDGKNDLYLYVLSYSSGVEEEGFTTVLSIYSLHPLINTPSYPLAFRDYSKNEPRFKIKLCATVTDGEIVRPREQVSLIM